MCSVDTVGSPFADLSRSSCSRTSNICKALTTASGRPPVMWSVADPFFCELSLWFSCSNWRIFRSSDRRYCSVWSLNVGRILSSWGKTLLASFYHNEFHQHFTGTCLSNWRTAGIGSSAFVLELLPSPSSRSCGRTDAPQFVHTDTLAATLARSSSKYRHSSFNSKLSRINSCCLSSNWRSLFY